MTDDLPRTAQELPRERVHRLASLVGLVVLAGLDGLPPDLLLGALLEVSERIPQLSDHRIGAIRERGALRLRERSAEKRTWTVHRQYADLHRLELRRAELEALLRALGRQPPGDPSRLMGALLNALGRAPQRSSEE
ncbi:MAG TPA: hypothetical protein DEP35_02305 [Deltaproteobacteria bacterium]|jgi:hypothetical protein|nr:hypothetical protein [Deltaproteobacteria bacterium]